MANYPTSLPSSSPTTHQAVVDEQVAIATQLGITGGPNKRGLIGYVTTTGSYTSQSNTSTTVPTDVTGLSLAFTVPPSGVVRVAISLRTKTTGAPTAVHAVMEGTTIVASDYGNTGSTYNRGVTFHYITGLTPGASKTYKAAFMLSSAGTADVEYGGGLFGSLEVWAA